MDLTALHHFYWVVCEGNFTNASRALKIAQPAISRAVIRLEESIGEPLLIRHKRKVEMTAAGNTLFLECQVIFQTVERLQDLRKDTKRRIAGPLHVAASDVVADHFMPGALTRMTREHPQLYPSVHTGPTSFLIPHIAAASIEFGIFFHVPTSVTQDVVVRPLRKIAFRLVGARRAVDAKDIAVLSSFIGSREIDSPDTRTYPTLDKLRKKFRAAAIRFSSNQLSVHRQLALKGAGVAILPEFIVRDDIKKGLLKDVLPKEKFAFDLKIVHHKLRPLSSAAQMLMTTLDDEIESATATRISKHP